MERTEEILIAARAEVRDRLLGEATGHDWPHIVRVCKLARRIAQEEGADAFVCELAALFHDLADDKVVESEQEGLRWIREWLTEHGVGEPDVEHILEIIGTMSFRGGGRPPMRTIEGRAVQDADRLDALGAIGIARTFYYAGSKGHVMHDPDRLPRTEMTAEQYRLEPGTAVNHFHEKLLKLHKGMNTQTGIRLAEERHAFMEQYLRRFDAEWNGSCE